MRICVTGGAGFIGSHVVDELLHRDHHVRVVDNYRTGRYEFENHEAEYVEGSILDPETLLRAFDGCDWIIHMAANADVRHGPERPYFDVEQNVLGTATVLDCARQVGTSRVFFASTASVYGNCTLDRIPEDAPFPVQNSLYGASKVAGEGLMSAYSEAFGFTTIVGRWVQVIGPRYLHGHIIDFLRKLRRDPHHLEILGDGKQAKSGLHVRDLARGIVASVESHTLDLGHHVYNFGTNDTFTVDESADLICNILGVTPTYHYTGRENGGWVGDAPRVLLNSMKARMNLGWAPEYEVEEAIRETVEWLTGPDCTYL